MGRLVGLVVVGAVLSACGSGSDGHEVTSDSSPSSAPPSPSASTFNLSGTMAITDLGGFYNDGNYVGALCGGDEGYDDVQEGTQVVVRDADGTQVALGELGPGSLTGNPRRDLTATCEFPLMVFGVPDSGDIYSVEVGHRGAISFKRADADSGLHLTLG